ncbi:HET-domain-containing protein [Pyrenochaeta sp. DS3sAY3a]|nr:HET-domain-containing protein [Pyrenochaeta sp. DS3sAY3a]
MSEYIYQPLTPDVDCIRLIELQPSDSEDAPLACRLVEVSFAQIPKYFALSYMWGDMSITKSILVDGKRFEVGESLFGALKYFRNGAYSLPIWADAICINQQDIPERNSQIRIMPHIYTRAETVLLWLYVSSSSQSQVTVDPSASSVEIEMLLTEFMDNKLSVHPYFQRVWVIQEIYKARGITVCSNDSRFSPMAWYDFIDKLKRIAEFSPGSTAPLTIAQELKNKYENSQNLLSLLQTYKESQCKDPRDKIYGFIGLASDCYGFPIDYAKSTYEVWRDTMVFMSWNNLADKLSIIELSRLVKRLLGCQQTRQIDSSRATAGLGNTIKITVIIVGIIIHLGPTLDRVISEFNAVDEWSASIYNNFSEMHGNARKESDLFMQNLETINDTMLKKIRAPSKLIYDEFSGTRGRQLFKNNYDNLVTDHNKTKRNLNVPSRTSGKASDCSHKLFQHKDTSRNQNCGRMGVGSLEVSLGDYVCRIPLLDRAIIVHGERKTNDNYGYRVVGTALLSIDLDEGREGIAYSKDELTIPMDAADVFNLTD